MDKAKNFVDIPEEYCSRKESEIVLIPVPFDRTSTWLKGADKGPEAIIEASCNMELYDIETDFEVYKRGIYTDATIKVKDKPEDMVQKITEAVSGYIEEGKFVVVVGGEHTVGLGAVIAFAEKVKELTVLQLDAHCDLKDEYNGSKYNHACVMARVGEIVPIVQVGIRSMDSPEKQFIDKARIFFAKDIYNNRDWIDKVVQKLSDNVYITIDLDVFDPSVMSSTGTPEPGGLLWYNVLALLRAVCDKKNVIGFDVVELCPNQYNKAPDFLAAKLIYKLLSYKFRGQNA